MTGLPRYFIGNKFPPTPTAGSQGLFARVHDAYTTRVTGFPGHTLYRNHKIGGRLWKAFAEIKLSQLL